MAKSDLQDPFLEELVRIFKAAKAGILRRVQQENGVLPVGLDEALEDELRGLYHALLVVFDGGTALANRGLISIVDEDGRTFCRYLHEICFGKWPTIE